MNAAMGIGPAYIYWLATTIATGRAGGGCPASDGRSIGSYLATSTPAHVALTIFEESKVGDRLQPITPHGPIGRGCLLLFVVAALIVAAIVISRVR